MLITDNNTQAPTATFKETTPLQGAVAMARRGLRITPLRGKAPFLSGWQEAATTDVTQIKTWAEQYPGCNFGCVFKKGEFWGLDEDIAGVVDMFVKETRIPIETFRVESSAGRFHWYFKATEDSDARLTNIAQNNFAAGAASVRFHNEQCVAAFSVHPEKLTVYRPVGVPAPAIAEAPKEFVSWLLDHRVVATKAATQQTPGQPRQQILQGGRDSYLFTRAASLRAKGLEQDEIEAVILRENEELCVPPMPIEEAKKCARQGSKYEKGDPTPTTLIGGKLPGQNVSKKNQANVIVEEHTDELVPEFIDQNSEAAIPPFDPSVINGIYGEIVKLITRGTTLAPQFAYVIAKTVVGIKMAGKVRFENLDVEPRYYTALIGETGSGKGEAWRRMMQILRPEGQVTSDNPCQIKIINSADSGAGIKDAFFEPPDNLPILCYVDEVEGLGNKSKDTRNPGILDSIIELADSTSVSRVLSKRNNGGGTKTKHDARFGMVMCGQDGNVYMKAFAGRTKLGLWDRFYPEFGTAQETGDLPPVNVEDAVKLFTKLTLLNYSGIMTISTEAKDRIESFWKAQTASVRKKARWKKTLTLDAYMSAFGRVPCEWNQTM